MAQGPGPLGPPPLNPGLEVRIPRGQRPGIVYPLPRAARPDTQLAIDAALPEAAGLHRAERPPTIVDIPEPGQLEETRGPESSHKQGIALTQAPHTQTTQESLLWSI